MFKIKINPLWIIMVFILSYFGSLDIVLLYFIFLLLHEMGHMYMARVLGYGFDTIDFMPYGLGIETNANYLSVKNDIFISMAGPIVNMLIMLIVVVLWWCYPISYYYTLDVFYINLAIFLFNLLPVFPLDGGRVFMILLKSKKKDRVILIMKITTIVSMVVFAILFFVSVFYTINISFFLIAVFLFFSYDNARFDLILYYVKNIYDKEDKGIIEVKTFYISKDIDKYEIIKMISSKYISRFIVKVGDTTKVVYEKDILNLIDKM